MVGRDRQTSSGEHARQEQELQQYESIESAVSEVEDPELVLLRDMVPLKRCTSSPQLDLAAGVRIRPALQVLLLFGGLVLISGAIVGRVSEIPSDAGHVHDERVAFVGDAVATAPSGGGPAVVTELGMWQKEACVVFANHLSVAGYPCLQAVLIIWLATLVVTTIVAGTAAYWHTFREDVAAADAAPSLVAMVPGLAGYLTFVHYSRAISTATMFVLYVKYACRRDHFPMLYLYWAESFLAIMSYGAASVGDAVGFSPRLRACFLGGRVRGTIAWFTKYGVYPYVILFLVNMVFESTNVHWKIFIDDTFMGNLCITWLVVIACRAWQTLPALLLSPMVVSVFSAHYGRRCVEYCSSYKSIDDDADA